jgi:hypothetical protein
VDREEEQVFLIGVEEMSFAEITSSFQSLPSPLLRESLSAVSSESFGKDSKKEKLIVQISGEVISIGIEDWCSKLENDTEALLFTLFDVADRLFVVFFVCVFVCCAFGKKSCVSVWLLLIVCCCCMLLFGGDVCFELKNQKKS